jgi:hypothetical protein
MSASNPLSRRQLRDSHGAWLTGYTLPWQQEPMRRTSNAGVCSNLKVVLDSFVVWSRLPAPQPSYHLFSTPSPLQP